MCWKYMWKWNVIITAHPGSVVLAMVSTTFCHACLVRIINIFKQIWEIRVNMKWCTLEALQNCGYAIGFDNMLSWLNCMHYQHIENTFEMCVNIRCRTHSALHNSSLVRATATFRDDQNQHIEYTLEICVNPDFEHLRVSSTPLKLLSKVVLWPGENPQVRQNDAPPMNQNSTWTRHGHQPAPTRHR